MLSQPVMDDVREGAQNDCDDYLMMMHDWSRLNYYKYTGKQDRIQLSHHLDVGYDMQSSLAVSDHSKKRVEKVPGEHIKARLVVSRIYDESGSLFATWYLITNVDDNVPDERIILWYYWRWKIETYFKLLKKAGQQLESWEQESAIAIMKRLQIANKACSVVWMLMRKDSPEAQEVKELLVRFSGRQMKRKGQTLPRLSWMDCAC